MTVKAFCSGNEAAAQAARICNIQVVAAYPITPQTSLVEHIASDISNGLSNARMIVVESEHSAMSACAGASLVGARTFTATSSQGLIYMSEVLHMTSGCRLPVVMVVVHRAVSAPVNMLSDQQDSMLQRDAGWVIFECKSAQEVQDTIPIAYRVAEDSSVHLPVMVCYDGFNISHTSEEIEPLSHQDVETFLAPVTGLPRPILDVDQPFQLGQLMIAVAFSEYQYKKHSALYNSIEVINVAHEDFAKMTGRRYSNLESYLCDDAEVVLVGMGSIMNTAKWTINKLREQGEKVGIVSVRLFRPFPDKAFMEATKSAKVLGVMDRNIGLGTSGMMFPDIARVFCNVDVRPKLLNFIVGLGGRNVPPETIERCYNVAQDTLKFGVTQQVFWPDTDLEGL